jgi:iron complex outermembrane receptor protein
VEQRFLSATPVNDANTPGAASPAHAVTGVRFGARRLSIGRTRLAPFAGINNLWGAEYNTAVAVNAFGQRFYEPGPGRSLYLGLEAAAAVR